MNDLNVFQKEELTVREFVTFSLGAIGGLLIYAILASIYPQSLYLYPGMIILFVLFSYMLILKRLPKTYGVRILSKKAYFVSIAFLILPVIRYVYFLSFFFDDLIEYHNVATFLKKLTLIEGEDFEKR